MENKKIDCISLTNTTMYLSLIGKPNECTELKVSYMSFN